ncbi:hypothetical protein [Streptomyces sp. NPDC093097]|uniref:hypothetical protein n=1 Tax=Streptomyces sp. NPDC093097 TaxID=3366027 RepID=UPI00382F608F
MRSPQLALCAAVAACAVTTAPAHADDAGRGTATAQTTVAPHRARTALPTGTPPTPAPAARTARAHLAADRAAAHRELSSTSAVALVLAGGAVLVIAGQLLRLRLRLRRERNGSGGADEN